MSKKAFITGISGMDGKLLSNFLIGKGYQVLGLVRETSTSKIENKENLKVIIGDLTDVDSILQKISNEKIDEFYFLGAQSSIEPSWDNFLYTYQVNVNSVLRFMEHIKTHTKESKIFYASSSEIFGDPQEQPQNENSLKKPRNPYGLSKLLAQEVIEVYRNLHGMFACSGILYNHESEFRRRGVVTKKIVSGVAKISLGLENKIILGNLDSRRDWSSAKDFVEAMWLILQHSSPDDYILSSNEIKTVRDLLQTAFDIVGISNWEKFIEVEDSLFRPCESVDLIGDNTKIKSIGWNPKISFREMIEQMIKHEIETLNK